MTGDCFDIGDATVRALSAFQRTGSTENNADPQRQANGSIMRLSPVAVCAASREACIAVAVDQGMTTHAAPVPTACCSELAGLLWDLIATGDRSAIGDGYRLRSRESIVSSGHAPATLDAAKWSVATTKDFRSAILRAANLGDDADTVGAVTGQIAGALYGLSAIPSDWMDKLAWRTELLQLGSDLWNLRSAARASH